MHTRVRERVRGALVSITTQSERTRQFQATTHAECAISRNQGSTQNTFELCLIYTARRIICLGHRLRRGPAASGKRQYTSNGTESSDPSPSAVNKVLMRPISHMDKPTIDAYNQQAQEYDDQTVDFWDSFPRTVFDKFIEMINGSKVLDVGSGPGRDGLLLKQRGLDVTCLDASQTMVDMATSKGLRGVCSDFTKMPFDDACFDAVWAYTSLLHVPKAKVYEPLLEITRVLKPDGVFGLGMIEGETEGYIQNSKVTKPRWFSYYSKSEIEKLLEKQGFKVVYFETFKPRHSNYLNFIFVKSSS